MEKESMPRMSQHSEILKRALFMVPYWSPNIFISFIDLVLDIRYVERYENERSANEGVCETKIRQDSAERRRLPGVRLRILRQGFGAAPRLF